jgi:hypothetical protein
MILKVIGPTGCVELVVLYSKNVKLPKYPLYFIGDKLF